MRKALFPNAIDAIRILNDNAVDNLLVGQPSSAELPSLYKRAYMLVHETGITPYDDGFRAPGVVPKGRR